MENINTDFRVSRVKEHLHRKPDLRKFTFVRFCFVLYHF